MERILVTGANGQIGANTIRSLIRHGYQVVPFVRGNGDLRGIEQLKLDYAYGDVMDYASLAKASANCDAIIHHAAVYRMWTKNRDEVLQTSLVGTRNIYKAAHHAGVRRLIYTSSMAAVGNSSQPDRLRTATDWNENPQTAYYVAKTEAERMALNLSEEYGVPTVRLCPTLVLGPYDYRITPSTKSILDFVNRRLTTWEGGSNYVHVSDVAEAHVAALKKGMPGERYIVGGDNLHMKELAIIIEKITGAKPIHLGITGPLTEISGILLGALGWISGIEPPYDRAIARDLVGRYAYYDCGQTYTTFGIEPHGAEEVIRDTVRWLLFLGKVKPAVVRRIGDALPPDPEW
jgi:dihydroflavonol-4-reductase